MQLNVGVLAPQGGFEGCQRGIDEAYADPVEAKAAGDLAALDGLIISVKDLPALLSLQQDSQLCTELRAFGERKPIFAAGAAASLLAAEHSVPLACSLGLLNMKIDCSPNNPELENRIESVRHEFDDESGALQAVFLTPPVIRWVGPEVKVIAKFNSDPILVEQGLHMAATFHPELSLDRRIWFYFVDKVRESYWALRLHS